MVEHVLETIEDLNVSVHQHSKVNFVKPTFVRIIAYMEELPQETGRMTTINATVIALLAPQDPVVKKTHVPR